MVNIGAGPAGKAGWVNLDGFRATGINCLCDARRRLPFPDGSVRGIFTEHFVEHLDYTEEVPDFISECYRALEPGGAIRIIFPDIEMYLKAYTAGGWEELSKIRPLSPDRKDHYFRYRYNTRAELINVIFRQAQEHKFVYDFETLAFLLRRHAYTEVTRRHYGQSVNPDLCIDTPERASESLYIEAIKPMAR